MLDLVRTSLHRAITTETGDRFLPVRLPKDIARRFNALLGDPLCSQAELDRRRAGRARLEELRHGGDTAKGAASSIPEAQKTQAPVMVYFEKDRNARMLGRIQEMLDSKSIRYTPLDVAGDSVTKNFVMRESRCKEDELPVVFIAGSPVGGYNELVDWDVSGRLERALSGG